jgi:hypothetical protein
MTISAGMIASVNGIRILIVVPTPGSLDNVTLPPIFATFVRTTARDIGDRLGGGKSWKEDELNGVLIADVAGLIGSDQATFHRLLFDGHQVHSRAIVGDLDIHLAALVERSQHHAAFRRFPQFRPL